MGYILGIDGGGTKTTAAIANMQGELLGESISGSSNFISVGEKKAAKNLNRAVFEAAGSAGLSKIWFESSCFGFAGLNIEDDLKIYKSIVLNKELTKHLDVEGVFICNDTRIGLEAGSDAANRIIIIAGTGSNCYGINDRGEEAGCTGWDYILADEGSGFETGVLALRAVIRAIDGRGEKTMLQEAVQQELGLKDAPDILKWVYGKPFSKERFGMFARMVCSCARKGDDTSRKILKYEAGESILSVATVARKLGLEKRKFDLVFVGGLFNCKDYFTDIVMEGLRERFSGIQSKPLLQKPVRGALKLAAKRVE